MLIEIDLEEAKRLKTTVNQFILISLLVGNQNVKEFSKVIPITEEDITYLVSQNILTEESIYSKDFKQLYITKEFLASFKTRDLFLEFFDIYPASVTRPDGLRDYLRGNISRCRRYYDKIVGQSVTKHEHMIDCLKFEIDTRKMGNKLGYMKRMAKWLFSEEWLLYDEFMKDKKIQKQVGVIYGTELE